MALILDGDRRRHIEQAVDAPAAECLEHCGRSPLDSNVVCQKEADMSAAIFVARNLTLYGLRKAHSQLRVVGNDVHCFVQNTVLNNECSISGIVALRAMGFSSYAAGNGDEFAAARRAGEKVRMISR